MSDAQGSDDVTESVTDASTDEDVEANVEAALREFLDALDGSETYQRFVEADEVLQADDDAMALLREYQRKQQQMQRGGFDESVMAELKQLQTEMSDNETIRRQQAAQADLIELLQQTNDAISDEIGEEFARSTGGGCC
ncbi:halo-CC-star protein HcsL [Halorubrum sp. F4]|uniref:halo-CC-star protein HcsL n=1 Tax=Halorubrum sp. F4 TaxID=2989715 RepID=UPI0024802289|nr:halo-CC-star protein HcsL [Halorubrum sp. F4]